MSFTPQRLRAALDGNLQRLPSPPVGLCVALSGGLDSSVLLVALAAGKAAGERGPLRALHVDHGLHADSPRWSAHCAALAARVGVPCEILRVDARARPGESPEATARAARYAALRARLRDGEVLLTAHHADDQLETVLLQWLRGGGLRALAGMRPLVALGAAWHARPLLGFTRDELQAWAAGSGLDWLEDPSNRELRFDRNYLRHEVVPALRRRWPAAARTVGRVAEQAAEALELDAAAAAADVDVAAVGETLCLGRLRGFDVARQRRVLREWLRRRGLAMPSAATLEALRRDALEAACDRLPETRWPGGVVRRYRAKLYADAAGPAQPAWTAGAWTAGEAFELGALGRLELRAARGVGLSQARLSLPLQVVARPAGATFRPAGAQHRRPLRKWLQERGVLPWWRASLPLVCAGGEIVAVGDLACGGDCAAGPGEASWQVVWHGRPVLTEADATAPHRPAAACGEVVGRGPIR